VTLGGDQPSGKVLHVDLILLREDITSDAREALYEEAAALTVLSGVLNVGAIEGEGASDFDLAFFFVLDSLASLEAFGTDQRYVRFLHGGLARALRSFGGADVQLSAGFERPRAYGACLALAATPQTYDWQVSDALSSWCASGESCMAGLAVGERQRYRGVGIMFASGPVPRPASGFEGFGLDFISGRCRVPS